MMNNDIIHDEIVSIEKLGVEETIDIQVSDNNLFFANGILTHNCGYDETPDMKYSGGTTGINKTGDVIIGISRTEEDIEMGVMRFNLMKNRDGPKDIFKLLKIDFNTLNIIEDDELDKIAEHEEHYSMFDQMSEM